MTEKLCSRLYYYCSTCFKSVRRQSIFFFRRLFLLGKICPLYLPPFCLKGKSPSFWHLKSNSASFCLSKRKHYLTLGVKRKDFFLLGKMGANKGGIFCLKGKDGGKKIYFGVEHFWSMWNNNNITLNIIFLS